MKKILIRLSVYLSSLGILLLGPAMTNAQIYKWVDAEGRVHYSDTPTDEAQDVNEELPPASRFTGRARPPAASPEEAPASDTEQPQQEASADPPAESPSTDESSPDQSSSSDQQQAQKDEIGLGEHGPFGPDGPGGPAPNPE